MVKNPNWQEADSLAIYKRDQGVELGATKKQLLLAVRVGLEPRTSRFQVRRPNPLDHAASHYRKGVKLKGGPLAINLLSTHISGSKTSVSKLHVHLMYKSFLCDQVHQ